MEARRLSHLLGEYGFGFLTGVDDPHFRPLVHAFREASPASVCIQERSDAAVGIAAGSALGSVYPVLALRPRHLAHGLAPLCSLNLTYRIPSLLLMTYADDPEPERSLGAISESLARIGIPMILARNATVREEIAHCRRVMETTGQPHALVLDTGIERGSRREREEAAAGRARERQEPPTLEAPGAPPTTRGIEAELHGGAVLRRLLARIGHGEPMVWATGFPGKLAHAEGDRDEFFYLLNSPGLAGPVATGLSLRHGNRRVWAVENEDGVLEMMGSWRLPSPSPPRNLVLVVLGRERRAGPYASAWSPRPERIASRLGFSRVRHVHDLEGLESALDGLPDTGGGPFFLYADLLRKVAGGSDRIELSPPEIRVRFERAMARGPCTPAPAPVAVA